MPRPWPASSSKPSTARNNRTQRRGGANAGPPSFNGGRGPAKALASLQTTTRAQRRTATALARVEAARARADNRGWAVERRARTRQLIELGGLVQKAGLVDLTGDDRAALLGAFLGLSDMLKGDGGAGLVEVWRRRGRKVFEAEQ
ncbi:MAG: conjugal transfer protein TraD [Phenylobacterium sp.]|nr:conjugal transfer protein TraD [Phenylobacterium sp.]